LVRAAMMAASSIAPESRCASSATATERSASGRTSRGATLLDAALNRSFLVVTLAEFRAELVLGDELPSERLVTCGEHRAVGSVGQEQVGCERELRFRLPARPLGAGRRLRVLILP